jgi:hypothetical protein
LPGLSPLWQLWQLVWPEWLKLAGSQAVVL